MSLLWVLPTLVVVAGSGVLALVLAAARRENERLRASLVRVERIGVGVDELRHRVTRSERS